MRRIGIVILIALTSAGALRSGYIKKQGTESTHVQLTHPARTKTKTSATAASPYAPYVSPVNFEKLAEVNPDIVGWIYIPGTKVDYPIVQGSDNDAYLSKSFEGKEAAGGSIFLDFESSEDMRGYHTILYGHNMKNGSMFSAINSYKDEAYFQEHQYFELYTPKERIDLKAVSCYYLENDPRVRRTAFRDQESFQTFVKTMLEPCPYAEMPEEPVKNLYTLVTCSYEVEDGRTVLFAVETDRETVAVNARGQ